MLCFFINCGVVVCPDCPSRVQDNKSSLKSDDQRSNVDGRALSKQFPVFSNELTPAGRIRPCQRSHTNMGEPPFTELTFQQGEGRLTCYLSETFS